MKTRSFLLSFLALIFFATSAYAELVQGQVVAVNAQDNSVTIATINPKENTPQQINLKIKDDAIKSSQGLQSLNDLSVGEEIIVEVDRPMTDKGDWKVQDLLTENQYRGVKTQVSSDSSVMGSRSDSATGPDQLSVTNKPTKEQGNIPDQTRSQNANY